MGNGAKFPRGTKRVRENLYVGHLEVKDFLCRRSQGVRRSECLGEGPTPQEPSRPMATERSAHRRGGRSTDNLRERRLQRINTIKGAFQRPNTLGRTLQRTASAYQHAEENLLAYQHPVGWPSAYQHPVAQPSAYCSSVPTR